MKNMKNETELPADVIEAIQDNRKITAVKLLRAQRNIDLKGAVELVEKYYEENPGMIGRSSSSETGIGRLILLIIVIVVLYALYQYTN
jgi:hypothetical protein